MSEGPCPAVHHTMATPSSTPSRRSRSSQEMSSTSQEAMAQPDRANTQWENGLAPVSEEAESGIGSIRRRITDSIRRRRRVAVPPQEQRALIKPSDCGDEIGYKWALKKKWYRLCVIFLCQVSMNLNTTLYSNAINGIQETFGVTPFDIRWGGAASFLIAYAFGCELWAPWSEEFGRRPILQVSLGLVNIWGIMTWLAPSWPVHVLGRFLGGLSSAGGSVTLAVITDLFEPDDPQIQHATSFIVLSSVGGSIIGPIIGGFVEEHLDWRWCIGIQVLFGLLVQFIHLFFMPETRATIIMDKCAKKQRKSGKNPGVYGPGEIAGQKRVDFHEFGLIWMRPFRMFMTEPIVLVFSLLSGFSDAIIFMMVQSLSFVYWQYGFNTHELGLAFIAFGVGYLIAYCSYFFVVRWNVKKRREKPGSEWAQYESRLLVLLYTAPMLPFGLIVFGFTSGFLTHPIHWSLSMGAIAFIGAANYYIYITTIDYVLRSYGPYAASATGGNGWARDFLAGVLTPYAVPMLSVFMASMILFAIACVLCGSVFVVYHKGAWLRHKSKFAQTLAQAQAESGAVGSTVNPENAERDPEIPRIDVDGEINRMVTFLPSESLPGSRNNSMLHLPLSTTPAGTPRCSVQLARPPNARLHSYQSHRTSRMSQEVTPVPIAEERPTTSSSRTCTCSTDRTLTDSSSRCKVCDGIRTGENSSPTSLREIENTAAAAPEEGAAGHEEDEGEGEVVIIASNPQNFAANGPEQFSEKKGKKKCNVM